MTSRAATAPPRVSQLNLSLRTRLLIGLIAAGVLALITIVQSINTYNTAFERFQNIAEDSTAKVDASEAALKYVANIDSRAAIFVATAPDNPIHWQSQDDIHASFQSFRDQMYIVRARLSNPDDPNDPETVDYNQISYFTFDQFWQHIGNLLTAEQNGDTTTATQEYSIADNYLQNQVIRYLLDLETRNFDAMQSTSNGAASAINSQTILLGIAAIALAILLTALSFWLRWRVRRILTPGLDIALVLGWVLAILMVVELTAAPNRLHAMVQDAYYSVSASARVLAYGNQAASAQSGEVIDPTHATTFWQPAFNDYINNKIALQMCGYTGCLTQPFTTSGDALAPDVLRNAVNSGTGSLIANITTPGEATALENARLALADFVKINTQINALVQKGALEDASRLSNGTNPGQAQEALQRFSDAINSERDIKRKVFDTIWTTEQTDLPTHRWLLGVGGYVLLIVALLIGMVQRIREL